MATTKNITMKQFNGTDYDTLYPKTVAAQIDDVYSKSETYPKSQLYTQSQLYTKQQVLTDATKTLYGLGSSATPGDVLSWIGQYNTYWWSILNTSTGTTTYVNSTNRNAHPDDGTVGTLTYRYLGIPFNNAVKSPEMEMGSYVGTGLTGEANPNSLTFNFAPRLVLVWGGLSGLADLFFFVRGNTTYKIARSDGSSYTMNCTFNGNNLSWYSTYDIFQANDDGIKYQYVAFK